MQQAGLSNPFVSETCVTSTWAECLASSWTCPATSSCWGWCQTPSTLNTGSPSKKSEETFTTSTQNWTNQNWLGRCVCCYRGACYYCLKFLFSQNEILMFVSLVSGARSYCIPDWRAKARRKRTAGSSYGKHRIYFSGIAQTIFKKLTL